MARGISIHIGLNRVDPQQYQGWSGELGGCINDANDMMSLATKVGYATQRMINEEATRANVIRAIAQAALKLSADDILLLTYSGHGGQVPDVNGDEEDNKDETWVLYDGMLIDDELYQLWSNFKPGVRILLLSDSCHSGTVLKVADFREALVPERSISSKFKFPSKGTNSPAVRMIPPEIALAVYSANPAIYAAAQYTALRGDRTNIEASVLLISGCQDNQLSADLGQNGLFTRTLLEVWNGGNFNGTYKEFHRAICDRMPEVQQPNYATVGRSNLDFENERPFSIVSSDSSGGNGHRVGTGDTEMPCGRMSIPPGLEDPDDARRKRLRGDVPTWSASSPRGHAIDYQLTVPGLENPDDVRNRNYARQQNGRFRDGGFGGGVRAAGALRDLILSIDKISVPFDADMPDGNGSSHYENRNGKRYSVTSTPRKAVNTFESLAAFDVHADVLWPGSLVQGRSLPNAVLQPIALPRAPGTIVLSNLMVQGGGSAMYTADITKPSLGKVQQAIQDLLAQKFDENTPARISFYMKQFYSLEHAMMQIGASYSWLSGSAKAELQSSNYAEMSNYVVRFVQAYYSVSFEPPGTPEALFDSSVSVDDAKLYMGAANPPTYVSTVTYGRMLMVFASTSAQANDLRDALSAAFSSYAASGSVSIDVKYKQILQETELKVLALGGPSSGVVKLLTNADKAKGLEEYLREGQNFTRQSPGVPISYEARYLRDNDIARVSFTTSYEVRTAVPAPVMINALQLRFHTQDDDKDPDARIVVEIRAGSDAVWRGDFGKNQTWNDHTDAPNSWESPWRLNLYRSVSLEDVRSMALYGEQADDNSGWNMTYDVWAICDDGTNPHVGGGGYRRIGDDQPRNWSDSFSGT